MPGDDCAICDGKGWVVDGDTVHRVLQGYMREGRGLAALGLVSQAARVGAAGQINIVIPFSSEPVEDPGAGDPLTVS